MGFQLSIARGCGKREGGGGGERERESYRSGGAVGLIISAPQTEERSEEKKGWQGFWFHLEVC